MKINEQVSSCPLFQTTDPNHTSLKDYQGRWVVLYFYPKDATPGCTLEGQDFRDQHQAFADLNTVVLGVSRDSLKSHVNFKTKQQFPFELISDPDEALCQYFDVMKMKSMYGKQVRGIERSTFIIDPKGIIRHIWRKVQVKGHVTEVQETLRSLQKTFP